MPRVLTVVPLFDTLAGVEVHSGALSARSRAGMKYTDDVHDLFLQAGTTITVHPGAPVGGASHDPSVLLGNRIRELDCRPLPEFSTLRTYDTYDGQNAANGPDCYEVRMPEAAPLNAVRMTMGLPYRDGGWWRSFDVEYLDSNAHWMSVSSLRSRPNYPTHDSPYGRVPFTSHLLVFDRIVTSGIRLVGKPGGIAEFTSLARLAGFHLNFSEWNPLDEPKVPFPKTYRLIQPEQIWDLSESLVKATGVNVMCDMLEFYLDDERYAHFQERVLSFHSGTPPLWFLAGDRFGWDKWTRIEPEIEEIAALAGRGMAPRMCIRRFPGGLLADGTVELEVDGEHLGTLHTFPMVILADEENDEKHLQFARTLGVRPREYRASLDRTTRLSAEQLEGIVELMGRIGQIIVEHAHRNHVLSGRIETHDESLHRRHHRKAELVREVIEWMEQHVEEDICVRKAAERAGLSHQYFTALFREETGQTPIEFLTDIRIQRAKEYFCEGTCSVLEVAVLLGYSQEHFSRLFKRKTGLAPDQYVRRYAHSQGSRPRDKSRVEAK